MPSYYKNVEMKPFKTFYDIKFNHFVFYNDNKVLGVCLDDYRKGDTVSVLDYGKVSVYAGEDISKGDPINSNYDGKAVVDFSFNSIGIALEDVTKGNIFDIYLNKYTNSILSSIIVQDSVRCGDVVDINGYKCRYDVINHIYTKPFGVSIKNYNLGDQCILLKKGDFIYHNDYNNYINKGTYLVLSKSSKLIPIKSGIENSKDSFNRGIIGSVLENIPEEGYGAVYIDV